MTPWVRTPEELRRLVEALEGCQGLALDSESDSLHHHFEKVCLLQLASDRAEAWLIDTLVLKDLSPLGPVLADSGVAKVLHGADYDVTTLKRDFGFRFEGLFDTMLAARFLGFTEFSLQALVRNELGIALTKDSQKDDWSRRPLTPRQEAYALDDVRHLLALHERLLDKLRERGRLEWVREECAAVAALPPAQRQKDPEAYLKIKGAQRLPPRALAILRELHAWRERRAEATDVPAFKLLGNDTLLLLAEKAPRVPEGLGRLPPRVQRETPVLLEAIERGRQLPASELPAFPRSSRPVIPPEVRRRLEALRAWRAERAARDGLDASLVLPQRLIDRLAPAAPRDRAGLETIETLRRWRIEAYGGELLAALS